MVHIYIYIYHAMSVSWTFLESIEIDQPETRITYGGHVCKRIGMNWATFIEDLPYMLSTMLRFICPSGFRGEDSNVESEQTTHQVMAKVCMVFRPGELKIGIICSFSANHTALRRKSKDWLARNQNNVSDWSDMSIHRLLFQLARTINI